MTDNVLDILKLVLLALLYLFFARVLWAVWSEVRPQRDTRAAMAPRPVVPIASGDATVPAARPETPTERQKRAPKGRGGRAARLVVLEPKAQRGATWAIQGELTIGREASCAITLTDDGFVSGVHARVFDLDGQSMVEDLGSTNGTFHNGNKLVGMKLLHPGDRIQIGYTVLEAQ